MSKRDEVKKILSLYLCEAADLDFRGMTEVTCKYAEQICQLFEPEHLGRARFKTAYADEVGEPDESLLLSDKEIKNLSC